MQSTRVEPAATTTSASHRASTHSPWLVTVEILSTIFSDAGKSTSAIRADIFKAEDRLNSRGERIAGNGLAAHGAIVRRGRKVLIDVHRYGNWLAGRPPVQG
jgi:hypothetical protein